MNLAQIRIVHEALAEGDWVGAAQLALHADQIDLKVKDRPDAERIIRKLLRNLLVDGDYIKASALGWGENFSQEPECVKRVFGAMEKYDQLLLMAGASMGKCISPNDNILAYDGRQIKARDITVGDKLMGEDSTPRTVLRIDQGVGPLYRVESYSGVWHCTGNHQLVLECGINAENHPGGNISSGYYKGKRVEVTADDFVHQWSAKRRRYFKQVKCAVNWPERSVDFDPYIYGCWLGDGHTDLPAVTKQPGKMLDYWIAYFTQLGFAVKERANPKADAHSWYAGKRVGRENPFTQFVKGSADQRGRFIRREYLVNSRQIRLKLLAGLIDTDGWVAGNGYCICTKYECLKDDIVFLARSLGFRVSAWRQKQSIKSIGFSAMYWRIGITGQVQEIPALEKHAKGTMRGASREAITVTPDGEGEYVGILVDGDNRFLLGDLTLVHNSYNVIAWLYLDWLFDPYWTSIKLTSRSEDHLRQNVWAHLLDLHNAWLIKPEGPVRIMDTAMYLGMAGQTVGFGFNGIAFTQSAISSGAWKGFKPQPKRPKTDPNYAKCGKMTRLRILADEAQQYPNAPWEDLYSVMGSMGGGRVKVACCFNPENMSQIAVQKATPPDGYQASQLDTLFSWTSKDGWHVERMDAAKSENVIARKEIFPGLQTYERYIGYLQGGGDHSASYYCADMKTEALTHRGWKMGNEITCRDYIYTINPRSGCGEWCKVREVFCQPYQGPMVAMDSVHLSALVTPNHRWAVTNKQRMAHRRGYIIRPLNELARHDIIPLAAPRKSNNHRHTLSDDFYRLLGWIITDGSLKAEGSGVVIYQSWKSNSIKCQQIRDLLERLDAAHIERQYASNKGIIYFSFYGKLGRLVRKALHKDKSLMGWVLAGMTSHAASAFLDAAIAGDGGIQGWNTRYITTKSRRHADMFSAVAAIAGISSHTHLRLIKGNGKTLNGYVISDTWMYYVNLKSSLTTRNQYVRKAILPFNGKVWCPRTDNGTWLARRHGTTYFTGNTFARGFPPLDDSAHIVIPASHVQSQRGEAIYIDKVAHIVAVDVALQGADKAGMGIGRWGLASGWRKANNQVEFFVDPLHPGVRRPRWVLTVDQLLRLTKSFDTVHMAQEIMGHCKPLGISPEWVAIDGTGNAMGVWSHLVQFWGNVLGIFWNEGATDNKILDGDKALASALYDGIPSEMWFSFKRWLDPLVTAVLINPVVGDNPFDSKISMTTQLVSRRFRFGKKLKVESKDEFKARNGGHSPDEADILVMMVHLCRLRGGALPGVGSDISPSRGPGRAGKLGHAIKGRPEESADDEDDRLDIEGEEDDSPDRGMEVEA